jgi:hypothetical protein
MATIPADWRNAVFFSVFPSKYATPQGNASAEIINNFFQGKFDAVSLTFLG